MVKLCVQELFLTSKFMCGQPKQGRLFFKINMISFFFFFVVSTNNRNPEYSFFYYFFFIQIIDKLSGHEGPVSSLHFNPLTSVLTSSSWDKTVRIWDVFARKPKTEVIFLFFPSLSCPLFFSSSLPKICFLHKNPDLECSC